MDYSLRRKPRTNPYSHSALFPCKLFIITPLTSKIRCGTVRDGAGCKEHQGFCAISIASKTLFNPSMPVTSHE